MTEKIHDTSEEWLVDAADRLSVAVRQMANVVVPPVRIGVGFLSGGDRGKALAESFPASATKDGIHEIIIKVRLTDPVQVLSALTRELIMVAMDCRWASNPYAKDFKQAFERVGFVGSPAECVPGDSLRNNLTMLAMSLGEYPREDGMISELLAKRKQTTRGLRCVCSHCGSNWRTARKNIDAAGSDLRCQNGRCPAGTVTVG